MTVSLNDALLSAYMTTFYGYGNYAADWWLVGMEEGGGNEWSEVEARLTRWDARGRRELEDVDIFDPVPELAKWFTARPPLQATWRGLIRLILAAEGRPTDTESVRAFQGAELGRLNGNTCIAELMPLPSPSIGHWIYAQHSGLPELASRKRYMTELTPLRVQQLRARISEHRPKAVIFYSRKYLPWWEQVAGGSFGAREESGIQTVSREGTLFVMTAHPVFRGLKGDYFIRAGEAMAGQLR